VAPKAGWATARTGANRREPARTGANRRGEEARGEHLLEAAGGQVAGELIEIRAVAHAV
jgi:hypothetical protein